MNISKQLIAAAALGSLFAALQISQAQSSDYTVGPGEYSQHYDGGGVRNFTVPDNETHSIDVQPGDSLTHRDPDTGEVTYFEAE